MRIQTFDRPKGYLVRRAFANSGTFTDPRDGNVYKTVEINGQIWLAENLRFEGIDYEVPDGNENNIAEYGCLYTWKNALKSCPLGWHLPSKLEMRMLVEKAGNTEESKSANLRSQSWHGYDSLGFNAMPAGYFIDRYSHFEEEACFWTATEGNVYNSYYLYLTNTKARINNHNKVFAFSVRCIKD